MSRARVVVALILLLLAAAPGSAAALSLGELLGPVIPEPVEEVLALADPVVELVDEVVALTDPVVESVEEVPALTDPVVESVEESLAPGTDPVLEPVEEVLAPGTDPVLDPVEEVLAPKTDPVDEVVGPLVEPHLDDEDGLTNSVPSLDQDVDVLPVVGGPFVDGEPESQPAAAAPSIASVATALFPPPSTGAVLPQSLAKSLLSQILDWLSGFDAGSFLAAPFLGLRVLLRALASAGQGLLIPGMMLVVLALMARDRRILGTKTP